MDLNRKAHPDPGLNRKSHLEPEPARKNLLELSPKKSILKTSQSQPQLQQLQPGANVIKLFVRNIGII